MGRLLTLLYGVVSYVIFLGSFLYAVGFVGNLGVPKSIDVGANFHFWPALAVNCLLLGAFAVQHSVMARQSFKRAWTKIIPRPIERSTFVLISSLLLILLYWQWQPITQPVWSVQSPFLAAILHVMFWLGWAVVLISTFMINHFDLFGLRQVTLHFRKKEYTPPRFTKAGLYSHIRHPIMAGFIVAFWATPHMTAGHLIFAVATTGYILVGIALEEKDLIRFIGADYVRYRAEVPMLVPGTKGIKSKSPKDLGVVTPELSRDQSDV
ncbi:MAG TPA: hypothetical protein VN285_05290 [Candidatus Deferrimicrobium sp.]|nr:hypothetical protein [Candidatus Deferrimicrobium sp.]